MAKLFTPNIVLDVTYPALAGAGTLFEMKNLLVTAGWSVVGSSDGSSFEFNGTTGGAGTGSGGIYDLWDTAADANGTNRWIVVEEPPGGGGRQYLFMRRTGETTGTFATSLTGGFTSAGASTSVPPSAPDEIWIWGATSETSAVNFSDGSGAALNCWARNDAVNGVYGFGWHHPDLTGSIEIDFCYGVAPVDNTDAAETQPIVYFYSTTSDMIFQATNPGTGTFDVLLDNVDGFAGFGSGEASARAGLSVSGLDQAAPIYLGNASPESFYKGTINTDFLVAKGLNRTYPDLIKVGTAPNEIYYVYSSNLSYLVPWDDAGTIPET